MHKSKCTVCGSSHTVKNGVRYGTQLYLCRDCGYQFRNGKLPSDAELWRLYVDRKQTVQELASSYAVSASTIKRRLHNISICWEQPTLSGTGFVHIDATYWGRNSGILLALDSESGGVLYLAFIRHESISDYAAALQSVEQRGYAVKGVVVDGIKGLFETFSGHKVQMCQFHMKQIVRRYLTLKPKLLASRELKRLMDNLTEMKKDDFERQYNMWKLRWKDTINKRSLLKSGKTSFRHRRLRSAMHSIDFYLPYLFTYQCPGCEGMPNTNNKIEGTFTALKKNLNNHSGMTNENRKRFICGFFLA